MYSTHTNKFIIRSTVLLLSLLLVVMTVLPYGMAGYSYAEEKTAETSTMKSTAGEASDKASDKSDADDPKSKASEDKSENKSEEKASDSKGSADKTTAETSSASDAKEETSKEDTKDEDNSKAEADKDKASDDKAEKEDESDKSEKSDDSDKEEDKEDEKDEGEEDKDKETEISFNGDVCDITLTYGKDAGLPDGTDVTAKEIEENKEEEYRKAALKALKEEVSNNTAVSFRAAKFIDITLKDGNKTVEPDAPVDVTVSLDKKLIADHAKNVHIIHFTEAGRDSELQAEVLDEKDTDITVQNSKVKEASFEAESFSVYGIVYTVDFHYSDYDYSMTGDTSILLSDVLAHLNMLADKNASTTTDASESTRKGILLSDVLSVEFSDPDLLKIEKAADSTDEVALAAKDQSHDWLITSLNPFDTDETLTLTLADNSQITINVTDAQYVCQVKDGNIISGSYTTLEAAFDNLPKTNNQVNANRTIELLSDCTVKSTIDFHGNTDARTITIKPADGVNNPIIYRGNTVNGDLITLSRGHLIIQDAILDGNNHSSTGSLVNSTLGTNQVALNNVTVRNHISSIDSVCAVNAALANQVSISGSTSITGNTANSKNANLNLGPNMITVTANHTGQVGITSDNSAVNEKFGTTTSNNVSVGTFTNDTLTSTEWGSIYSSLESRELYWRDNLYNSDNTGDVFQVVSAENVLRGKYTELSDAYSAASNGDRIELLKDYILKAKVSFSSNKTITLTTSQEYKNSHDNNNAIIIRYPTVTDSMLETSNGSITIRDITIDGNSIKRTGNGGIISNSTTLVLESGAVLQNGIAYGNGACGGGVYNHGANGSFTMKNGCVIQDCKAYRNDHHAGGGVGQWGNTFTMDGGIIRRCHAPAYAGGGIGIDHGQTTIINNGIITECTALYRGAAIEDHGNLYINGGTITGNRVISNDTSKRLGGAINFYSDAKRLYFTGSPRIYGNYSGDGSICNVDIYHHDNNNGDTYQVIQIQADKGINSDAVIGVWNGGTTATLAEEDGRFGTYENGAILNNLSSFVNDRNDSLFGTDGGNHALIWAKGIKFNAHMYYNDINNSTEIVGSKGGYGFEYPSNVTVVTEYMDDRNGVPGIVSKYQNKMKYLDGIKCPATYDRAVVDGDALSDKAFEVRSIINRTTKKCSNEYNTISNSNFRELAMGKLVTAYYSIDPLCKVTDGLGNILYLVSGNPTLFSNLSSAFDVIGNCYKWEGEGENRILVPYTGKNYKVQMLVDSYELDKFVEIKGDYNVTLTTETNNTLIGDSTSGVMTIPGASQKCTITRKAATGMQAYDSMFKSKFTNLTFENITISGNKSGITDLNANGVIVNIESGVLNLKESAELINGKTSGNGGAISLAGASSLNMTGGTISGCESGNNGGAICDNGTGASVISGGTISGCTAANQGGAIYKSNGSVNMSAGSISGCSAQSGAGISLNNTTASMSGGTVSACISSVKGGGIYLAGSGAALSMTAGNVSGNYGGGVYLKQGSRFNVSGNPSITGNTISANDTNGYDVVLDSNTDPNTSEIHLAGALTTDINVYATNLNHYDFDKQFAVKDASGSGEEHFINQRVDGAFGTMHAGDSTNIYWGRKLIPTTVTNMITGDYSDLTREFTYKLTVSGASTTDTYGWTKNGEAVQADDLRSGSTFTLGNNEYVTINLPAGLDIAFEITDPDGYTTTFSDYSGLDGTATEAADAHKTTFKIAGSAASAGVKFTNTIDNVVPSGENKPNYTMMLMLMVMIWIAMYTAYHLRHRGQDLTLR